MWYAEVVANKISGDGDTSKDVALKQQTSGWQNSFEFPANLTAGSTEPINTVTATVTATDTGASINIKLT